MPRGGERRRGGLSRQRRHGRLVDTLDDEGAEIGAAAMGARGRGSGGTAEGTAARLLFYTLTISDVRTRVRTIVIFRLLAALKRASGGCVQGARRPAHTPQSLDTVAKTACVRTHVRRPGFHLTHDSGCAIITPDSARVDGFTVVSLGGWKEERTRHRHTSIPRKQADSEPVSTVDRWRWDPCGHCHPGRGVALSARSRPGSG